MKLKEGFVMRKVAGQNVVIATGEASLDFHGMVKMNDTGAAIWQGVADGLDREGIAARLCERFDVGPERARADVDRFVDRMVEQGFAQE